MRARPRFDRDEAGAYLVLYALLAVALFTIAAMVIDIAALRQDRRADRAAADLAITAGADDLDPGTPATAVTACQRVWDYFRINRPAPASDTVTPPDCSATFGGAPVCTGASGVRTATGFVGTARIDITNPVPDADPLMLAESQGGDRVQTIVAAADGTQCQRIAIRIRRTRAFVFGAVAGFKSGNTDVHAVARPKTGGGSTITPLVTLDPAGCPGVDGAGGTVRAVAPSAANSEAIAVDTTSCGGATVAIGGAVRAEVAGGAAGFARVTALTNTGAPTFGTVLSGQAPTTAQPVELRYNTAPAGGCPVAAPACTADLLATALGGPGAPTGYADLRGFGLFPNCKSSDFAATISGLFYMDCPGGFTVDTTWDLKEDTSLVFTGPVTVTNSGCLSVAAPGCAPPGAGAVDPSTLFIRNGNLKLNNQGDAVMNNTFVYLANGAFTSAGAPNSRLWWRAPAVGANCPTTSGDPACSFDDLLLWSKVGATTDVFAAGAAPVALEGVIYAPNALVQFDTDAGSTATAGFQAYVKRFRATSGTVTLQPDPTRAVKDVATSSRLVR